MDRKIILLRHAESEKNMKHIHGGNGEAITQNGELQVKDVAEKLRYQIDLNILKIYASTSFHTRATAKMLANSLKLEVEQPIDFKPLNLGVADGLSEHELSQKYPDVQNLFCKWRKRLIDIKELKVPNMESPLDFWNRGLKILSNLDTNYDSLLVCSNSLMILLCNIMLGNHPTYTDNYKHITIPNCGIIAFDRVNTHYSLDKKLTNVNLNK